MIEQSSEWVSRAELSRRLGLNAQTVDKLVSRKELPCPVALGGKLLFNVAEVEAALEAARRKA